MNPYLKESDDCHLIVGDEGLGLGYSRQGGDSGAGALLQPADDVVRLSASCKTGGWGGTHRGLAGPV